MLIEEVEVGPEEVVVDQEDVVVGPEEVVVAAVVEEEDIRIYIFFYELYEYGKKKTKKKNRIISLYFA
jgi:hypothetical protein